MVKITKVYTKTGDQGETGLSGNVRIKKCTSRIEAIGTIDELNASLGLAIVYGKESFAVSTDLVLHIQKIQNQLFDLGASLATPKQQCDYVTAENVKSLEHEIDTLNKNLPTLNSFILPGGSKVSAQLHIARTICRRAERRLVALSEEAALEKNVIPYVNRLSDWLFVAARLTNHKLDVDEPLWKPVTQK